MHRIHPINTGKAEPQIALSAESVQAFLRDYMRFDLSELQPNSELGLKILREAIPGTSPLVIMVSRKPDMFSFQIGAAQHVGEYLRNLELGTIDIFHQGNHSRYSVKFDLRQKQLGKQLLNDIEIQKIKDALFSALPIFS